MKPFQVLIVDDERPMRLLERSILETSDIPYAITEAKNGLEALEHIKRIEFDVVLLDKRMPVMDGDETCRRIRGELNRPLLPIIMVTATNAQEDLARSLDAGANDFIRKPYSPIELTARIGAAVRNKRLTDQLDSAEALLFTLARMVEAKDATTGSHCSRLAHVAVIFGRKLGLDEMELEALRKGGVLHDIGKLGIPDSILLKNGPLNEAEWAIMRQHTTIGAHLCEGLSTMKLVVPIIQCHHERWDGSGYPGKLSGEDIPYLARIFQIVDIYDALSFARPYKKAFGRDEVIQTFEQEIAGGWRDPALTYEFLQLLAESPEILALPEQPPTTRDELAFQAIAATGAINWGRNPQV